MLRKVIAESSLHAGRAEIRRVFLDPRTPHVDDLVVLYLQIDLTSHAAIRADAAHGAIEHGKSRGDIADDVSIAIRRMRVAECGGGLHRRPLLSVARRVRRPVAVMAAVAVRLVRLRPREREDVVDRARWTHASSRLRRAVFSLPALSR